MMFGGSSDDGFGHVQMQGGHKQQRTVRVAFGASSGESNLSWTRTAAIWLRFNRKNPLLGPARHS